MNQWNFNLYPEPGVTKDMRWSWLLLILITAIKNYTFVSESLDKQEKKYIKSLQKLETEIYVKLHDPKYSIDETLSDWLHIKLNAEALLKRKNLLPITRSHANNLLGKCYTAIGVLSHNKKDRASLFCRAQHYFDLADSFAHKAKAVLKSPETPSPGTFD